MVKAYCVGMADARGLSASSQKLIWAPWSPAFEFVWAAPREHPEAEFGLLGMSKTQTLSVQFGRTLPRLEPVTWPSKIIVSQSRPSWTGRI